MLEHDDAQMRDLFAAAVEPLPGADFSAGVMQQLERQERAGRMLMFVQGGALLGLLGLLALFVKGRLLMWTQAASVPELLAQNPWWLAGLMIALCLLPMRLFTAPARPV